MDHSDGPVVPNRFQHATKA